MTKVVLRKLTVNLAIIAVIHAFIVGIFIIIGALIINSNSTSNNSGSPALAQAGNEEPIEVTPPPEVNGDDHVYGSRDADVFLVEYSDFECPFCQAFHSTAKELVDESDGKVAWVYRHYPLSFHPQAEPAALASECVADIGGNDAFWDFSDLLFENQTTLSDDTYAELASSLGVSSNSFENCYTNQNFIEKVQNDFKEGTAAGVQGTPHTFVINKDGDTFVINGAQPIEEARRVIEQALDS